MTSPLKSLLSYAGPDRSKILKASIFSVLNKTFDILPEVFIGVAVDTVVNKKDSLIAKFGFPDLKDQLWILGLTTFLVWGFESLFQYLYSIEWRNLAQTLQHRLRKDTFAHVQQLPMSYFEDKNTGNLMSVMNDDINQLERFLDGGANSLLQITSGTILVAGIFFYLAPMIAALALLPIPVILVGAYFFQERLGPRYAKVRENAGLISERLNNSLTGMAVVKSYTAEGFELEALEKQSNAYRQANAAAIRLSSAFIPLLRMAVMSGFMVTLVVGGFQAFNGTLAVGSYSVLVFLTQRLLWPFTGLGELTDLYERAMASTQRVLNLLATPIPKPGHQSLDLSKRESMPIRFEHVSLVYPNGYQAINDLSFEVKAGETVAFVGTTGSGKTSITKLLLRFYEPSSGKILVDALDVESIHLQNLRQSIGFVSQDVFLFHGTVRENIAYGSFDARMNEIINAAKMAEAHEFINTLPQGYDTVIGERGQKLSGGQRQRLSIARAILKNPPIFIFDEATSAVDTETESAIQRSINQASQNRTTILIAHRLSTVRHADCIYVLEHGQIIESGTHDELINRAGAYQKLWEIQTGASI